MNDYPLVSVYTCVYNGERTLSRVFSSMKNLDYPNIEHIIVNDGSTDRTDLLVQEYMKEVTFPVKYHKKENGGKHSALNVAWDMAEGEFLTQLDADDELLPHGVRFLVDTYFQIPEGIRDQYWCVGGRCVTQMGDFVGDRYPEGINDLGWIEAGIESGKCKGEKIGLMVREYLCKYRFPEVVGVSHIPEGIVWNQINKVYGTWYTNEAVRVYYVGEGDNLTDHKKKRKQFGPKCYWYKWKLMHPEVHKANATDLFCYCLSYFISDNRFRKNNSYFKDLQRYRIYLAILAPVAYVGALIYRIVKQIR